MEYKTANSKYLKNIYPDVYIENVKVKTGSKIVPQVFSWFRSIKYEMTYEYRSYLHTNLRLKRKSDNKYFLIRYALSYDSRSNTVEEFKQWINKCYDEIYKHLFLFIIPEENNLYWHGDVRILLDENQEPEEERLERLIVRK